MATTNQLHQYLQNSRNQFEQHVKDGLPEKKIVHFTLGNEAADLDSIVCAISSGYLLQQMEKNSLVIPLINIPPEDYSLRTDATWFFGELGVHKERLVFVSPEIQQWILTIQKQHPQQIQFTLVDHNRSQEAFSSRVVEIIDHHKDESLYQDSVEASKRVIEMVGSAATLVAEKVLNEHLLENLPQETKYTLCKLLLGPILLDTVNLDPKFNKVTPKDEKIAQALCEHIKFDKTQQTQLFSKLQEERFNVSSLSTTDLLRVDYKAWNLNGVEVGISSAKRSIEEWLQKDSAIVQHFNTFYEQQKLDLLMVMTAVVFQDSFKRELVVFYKPGSKSSQLSNLLEYLFKSDLQLEPIPTETQHKVASLQESYNKEHGSNITFGGYHQKNVAASRKQLQPLVNDFFCK